MQEEAREWTQALLVDRTEHGLWHDRRAYTKIVVPAGEWVSHTHWRPTLQGDETFRIFVVYQDICLFVTTLIISSSFFSAYLNQQAYGLDALDGGVSLHFQFILCFFLLINF